MIRILQEIAGIKLVIATVKLLVLAYHQYETH